MSFQKFHDDFDKVLGTHFKAEICLENSAYPFAHEAGVYIPKTRQLFVTSNRLHGNLGEQNIQISKVQLGADQAQQEEIHPDIPMANGAVNYKNGVLFCSQGSQQRPSSLVYMECLTPYTTTVLLDNFYGRHFNSINDVVVHSDGSIWFTDPIYGHEQGFRPPPELPGQVYRFEIESGSVRVMADQFNRPNGITFAPDERTIYITDTDAIHGDGSLDLSRVSTIYAFDIVKYAGEPFLVNQRVFAMANDGVPDGIKCDLQGNVYSGCGDGINVWSPGGVLLGKILISGGVSNFCFGQPGNIWALNEHRIWKISLSRFRRGCLLNYDGCCSIEIDESVFR